MRKLTLVAAALMLNLTAVADLYAQGFPTKPVRVLVGFAAGGPTDIITRVIAQDMSARMGQALVVENRAGASGIIALDALLAAPSDGYTISAFATPTVVASIFAGKAWDPASALAFIGNFTDSGSPILVNPEAPLMAKVKTLADLLAVAKANPGKISYSTAGTGSTTHLFGVMLSRTAGVDWTHVGYKGMGPAGQDLLAGRLQFMVGRVGNDEELVKQGKLRAVANSGAERHDSFPDAPSIAEAGYPGIASTTWIGLVTRAGTPVEALDKLRNELRATVRTPDIQSKLAAAAAPVRYMNPQQFAARVSKDYRDIAATIRENNIKAE